MANRVFDFEINTSEFFKEKLPKYFFYKIPPNFQLDDEHDLGDIAINLGSDWISGSHFIMQKSKFLLISATTVTLG